MLNFVYNFLKISSLKKILKKKLNDQKKIDSLYIRALIHFIRFIFFSNYRRNRCLIDPPSIFFYKYRKLANYFSIPLLIFARYLKKKKIFISVHNNCNSSIGHIFGEIDQFQRIQKIDEKYFDSTIWFPTSRKEILRDTKDIFENKNFKILFGGIKRIFLTFIAIKYPSISIDASLSADNYVFSNKELSNPNRVIFHDKPKKRAMMIIKTPEFYPNKDKLLNYREGKYELMQRLNIIKKYVVIQIKTEKVNGTLKPLSLDLFLKSIKYFQDKDYQIVFAGRESCPKIFLDNDVIDYANSKCASPLNDFLLIGHSSLVISSASGFCFLPESLEKPLLIINAHHISQHFGRRTIYLPTLLSRRSEEFNASIQQEYLCTNGADCGYDTFDDLYIFHIPTSEEIFMAVKELEGMLSDQIPLFTSLQKKIRESRGHHLLSDGLSRISDYYLSEHNNFFK
jgi:putative glycosyltransferase (TIGR04372 family)